MRRPGLKWPARKSATNFPTATAKRSFSCCVRRLYSRQNSSVRSYVGIGVKIVEGTQEIFVAVEARKAARFDVLFGPAQRILRLSRPEPGVIGIALAHFG